MSRRCTRCRWPTAVPWCASRRARRTRASALGTSHAYAVKLDASDRLVTAFDLGAYECRGLAAEPDGHFAALLWAASTTKDCADPAVNGAYLRQALRRRGHGGLVDRAHQHHGQRHQLPHRLRPRGKPPGVRRLALRRLLPRALAVGPRGRHAEIRGFDAARSRTTWSWGCSHSMSNLLRYNGADKKFMPACVTDCYPGTTRLGLRHDQPSAACTSTTATR